MKTTFLIIVISVLSLTLKGQNRDTAEIIRKNLIGTWVDNSNANHVIIFNANGKMVENYYHSQRESVTYNYSIQYKYVDANTPGIRLNAKEDYDTTKVVLAIYTFSRQIEFSKDRFTMADEDGNHVFKRKK